MHSQREVDVQTDGAGNHVASVAGALPIAGSMPTPFNNGASGRLSLLIRRLGKPAGRRDEMFGVAGKNIFVTN
jgi:hypothetical protein